MQMTYGMLGNNNNNNYGSSGGYNGGNGGGYGNGNDNASNCINQYCLNGGTCRSSNVDPYVVCM
jgi:hypothetical protein